MPWFLCLLTSDPAVPGGPGGPDCPWVPCDAKEITYGRKTLYFQTRDSNVVWLILE